MPMIFSLLQYVVAFGLGALISAMLSGAQYQPRWLRKFGVICTLLLATQLLSLLLFGFSVTKKLYPLVVHLPLWGLLVLLLKTPGLQTAVSVLVAYLCCQPPRWIASFGLLIPETHVLYSLLYLPVAAAFFLLIRRNFVPALYRFLSRSRVSCLQMGFVPALYYLFDYVTTVYTDLLTSGNPAAVQFMPSVLSIAYLLFVTLYHAETEKQLQLSAELDALALQLHQSHMAFSAMQQVQEQTRQYRHDMRHHFTLLSAYAAENNLVRIQQYLATAQGDLDALTPKTYCANETVNVLLSYFISKAAAHNIDVSVKAALPSNLAYSETELCSLLSNALENAIHAASAVEPPQSRRIGIHLGIQSNHLLMQVENTFTGTLVWQDGLPCADQDAHGYGTRSIRAIARSHGGEAIFHTHGNVYQLRVLLPDSAVQNQESPLP